MANATGASQGARLRPEDATTLEEFQARREAELARISAPGAYWMQVFRVALAIGAAGIDAFYWYRASQASGEEVWHVLALALLFACSTISAASSIKPDVLTGSKRRRAELNRLSAQWQARAEAGEVALTTLTTLAPVVDLTSIGGAGRQAEGRPRPAGSRVRDFTGSTGTGTTGSPRHLPRSNRA